jgi:hypothetical protein
MAEEGGQLAGPMDQLAERVFPCVKLRGLPFDSNEEEPSALRAGLA